MPGQAESNWTLPVSFHFLADFQHQGTHFQTSFTEVSGLDMKLSGQPNKSKLLSWFRIDSNSVEFGNITLKRPVNFLESDDFTQWVNESLKFDKSILIKPYDVIIKLLDNEGSPLGGWICSYAYPIQWTFSGLDSAKSGLVIETVVLTCNRIGRIKR